MRQSKVVSSWMEGMVKLKLTVMSCLLNNEEVGEAQAAKDVNESEQRTIHIPREASTAPART